MLSGVKRIYSTEDVKTLPFDVTIQLIIIFLKKQIEDTYLFLKKL